MILPVDLSPALALGLTLILTGALTCACFWRVGENEKENENEKQLPRSALVRSMTFLPFFLFFFSPTKPTDALIPRTHAQRERKYMK